MNMTGKPSLGFCAFVIWGLVLSCSSERQYFPQNTTKTWIDARKQCQVCFTELVTLTAENTQNIARGLTSEHWIGLRKRPLNLSDNSYMYPYHDNSTFWSHWANGDLLAFQNWYPGYPVFKSPNNSSRKDCCSCSCTCPAKPTTTPMTTNTSNSTTSHWSFSTTAGFTRKPLVSECERSPMLFREEEPDPNEKYIEDPCVAMLRFGAWVEKECTELLPFICYEDRFNGMVRVTDIKSNSANISWDLGPGDISHYRMEVNGSFYRKFNGNEYTHVITRLEPGANYSVKVFPVKCGRDLNPQNQTFYTVPNKVTSLEVVDITEKCVSLNWTKPYGNVDLYNVTTSKKTTVTRTLNVTVCDLTSGHLHKFIVTSGVDDQSQHSEEYTIDTYTKPGKVSNINTSDITDSSLVLSWDKPSGNASGYRVNTSWDGKEAESFMNETVENGTDNKLYLKDLPSGTKITLKITALANGSLEGEGLTVVCVTKPKDITNLNLNSTNDTITAEWSFSKGSPRFTVELFHGKDLNAAFKDIDNTTVTFLNLNSSGSYTVTVFTVTAETKSNGFSKSIFTKPNPPRDPELSDKTKNSLTFSWTPPLNTGAAQYLVTLNSSFWGLQWEATVTEGTKYTFNDLKSGTNYTFRVLTKAGPKLQSRAVQMRAATDSVQKQITLSMVCSSETSLLCDAEATRLSAFQELQGHFQNLLGDHIFWNLERMETENTD